MNGLLALILQLLLGIQPTWQQHTAPAQHETCAVVVRGEIVVGDCGAVKATYPRRFRR